MSDEILGKRNRRINYHGSFARISLRKKRRTSKKSAYESLEIEQDFEITIAQYLELAEKRDPARAGEFESKKNEVINHLLKCSGRSINKNYNLTPHQVNYDRYFDAAIDTIQYCLETYDPSQNDAFMAYFHWVLKRRLATVYQKIEQEGHGQPATLDKPVSDTGGKTMIDFIPSRENVEADAIKELEDRPPCITVRIAILLRDYEGFLQTTFKTAADYCYLFYTLDASIVIRDDAGAFIDILYHENIVFPALNKSFLNYLFEDDCGGIEKIRGAKLKHDKLEQRLVADYKGTSRPYTSKIHTKYYAFLSEHLKYSEGA